MKIRTLLIIGLFILAFTPLLFFMGLNMPRVLTQFKAAEEDRQLLLIQGNAREIAMNLKWKQDSLRALSFNMGAVELTSNRSTDFPAQILKKRVKRMLTRWYQDNPEVLAIRLFDRQGLERFAVNRGDDGELTTLSEGQVSPLCPPSLIALADLHPDGTVYNDGLEFTKDNGRGQHPVMRLGVALLSQGEVVGAACLFLDLSPMLQGSTGSLIQYNIKTGQYTPLDESDNSVIDFEFPKGMSHLEPTMMSDRNGQPLALIPFFADEHTSETVFLVYPVTIGSTMAWVDKWRKQVLILFGFVLLIIFLIAVKLSTVIDRFSQELLTALQALLHRQQPVAFSWSGSDEAKRLSQDLNTISLQYIESLNAQEEMARETRKMESELRQSQKMKALGLLAGGVAHDLNNILSGIVGYPQLLLLQLPEESDLRSPILEIQRSGERAAAVVADLLTVARGVASKKEYCNLNSLAREYLESPECIAQQNHYPEISCTSRLFSDELPVLCSPVHIKKTLMNLVNNATESIQGKGQIVVSTRKEQLEANNLADSNLLPGDYAILQVEDTGPGIGEEDLEHIFEPFYSRKMMGRSGTGLGLTVVWNTMNDHGGRVKVTSSNEGTCFELFFPLDQGRGKIDQKEDPTEKDLQGNGEQILVIDDEPQQRDLAARILGTYGYRVETVASGEDAVKFLTTQKSDLLLMDMIMDPGINGYETYRQILKIRPHQKAIIVSGFSESHMVEKTKQLGAMDLVKKPYSIEILARTVKNALKEGDSGDTL